ncbi:hypothetical protein B0H19DRAFT_1237456 [Mycena capillaripes]|nr:hypothetical protein B0H19DRAFT_1237456 [Mycena capillaripes]
MEFEFDNFRIQCMLDQGPGPTPGVQWLNQIRRGLRPDHGPVHISVVPHFAIHEDHYEDLLDNIAAAAAQWEPFEFEAVGMCRGTPNGCVAILVRDDDGVLEELMDEVPPLVKQRRNHFPPHVTIYKGSRETYFSFFGEILDFKSLRSRLESRLNRYKNRRGGCPVSGKFIRKRSLKIECASRKDPVSAREVMDDASTLSTPREYPPPPSRLLPQENLPVRASEGARKNAEKDELPTRTSALDEHDENAGAESERRVLVLLQTAEGASTLRASTYTDTKGPTEIRKRQWMKDWKWRVLGDQREATTIPSIGH